MKTQDYKRIIRKAGINISEARYSSRVKGWCSGISKGIDFSSIFPWSAWYVRNGYRLKSIIADRTQKMTISEYDTTGQLDLVRNLFNEKGIAFVDNGNNLEVEVDNPFSEADVKFHTEKWNRLARRN